MAATAVLFDIDGTLVASTPTHLVALADTASEVLGIDARLHLDGEVPVLNGRPVSGCIDVQCFREFARGARIDADEALVARWNDAYAARYLELLDAGHPVGSLMDGAEQLLYELHEADVAIGLCTGNAHRVGQAKLERLGIAHHFSFSADAGFGDTAPNRAALVPRAAAALGVRLGDRQAPVVVVGDTGRDMEAAWRNGAFGLGVTTGAVRAELLWAAGAHAVASGPADVLALVLGPMTDMVNQPACWLCGLPGADPCRDCGGTGLR